MIKGLKCNSCSCVFKWNDATERKMQGVKSICKCPECNQLIASDITTTKFVSLIVFTILFFILLFWSVLYSTSQSIIIIGASGFVLSFLIPPLFFKSGYMQMFKING